MRIPSGTTDQYLYFVAVDSTDLKTRETALGSFTVVRSRNGAADATYTTPTVAEVDATTMPGVYTLLLDEDMDIAAGNDSEEICLHITQASMAPVTRVFELYRREVTGGETLTVTSGLASANTTQIEGVDATNQIRDAIVDDATRIDASALNTASVTTIPAILDDTDLIDDATSGLAKIATDVAAVLVDTAVIGAAGAGLTALATQASVNTIDGIVDDILVDTAEIGTAGAGLTNINLPDQTMNITGDITGNLSGSVGSVTGAVGSVTGLTAADVGAIKTQTDKLTFTVANQVDSNIQYVNDVQITGTGVETTDEWRPV